MIYTFFSSHNEMYMCKSSHNEMLYSFFSPNNVMFYTGFHPLKKSDILSVVIFICEIITVLFTVISSCDVTSLYCMQRPGDRFINES